MSLKKIHDQQPKEFDFTNDNQKKIEIILKRYPEKNKKSAVMPLLYLAQKQNSNWIPLAAMKKIANLLSMPYISRPLSPIGILILPVPQPNSSTGPPEFLASCK